MLRHDNEVKAAFADLKAKRKGFPVHPEGKQRVSGSTEGRADEHKSDGQGAGRGQVGNRKGVRLGLRSKSGEANLPLKHYQLQVPTTGYQAPDADSWSSSHIRAHTGTPPPKKHWLDAVPWRWRLVALLAFGLATYVYGRMLGAW
jgi:hypothetical protein